jgi:hypothetical protein
MKLFDRQKINALPVLNENGNALPVLNENGSALLPQTRMATLCFLKREWQRSA